MKIESISPNEIKPYKNNPMIHGEDQVDQIADSIEEFGFCSPILVTEDLEVVAGHGRLEASKKLGLDRVPVIRLGHLTPTRVKAYRVADNALQRVSGAQWDLDMLKVELASLEEEGFDVALTAAEEFILNEPVDFGDEPDSWEDEEDNLEEDDGDDRGGDSEEGGGLEEELPAKKKGIKVTLRIPASVWLSSRGEIIQFTEKLATTYEGTVRIDE